MSDLRTRLTSLLEEIRALAARYGRDPLLLRLVAVSKTRAISEIEEAMACGQTRFGENYAQEFSAKYAQIVTSAPPRLRALAPEWHFIGHLQGNKAKLVAGRAALIHTVDRLSLADELRKIAERGGFSQNILLQVKISAATDKTGCPEDQVGPLVVALKEMPQLKLKGLMVMATQTSDTTLITAEFARVRALMESVNRQKLYPTALTELSMGMSGDFAIAIAEGATLLRIGTRIFGER